MTTATAPPERRFAEVDALKAAGIVAVILIHSLRGGFDPGAPRLEVVMGLALRFAVPAFLMASGFLYATRTPVPAATTGRRLRRILVPYLLVSLAAQAWWAWRGMPTPGGSLLRDLLFASSFGPYYYVFVITGLVVATPLFARMPPRAIFGLTLGFVAVHFWIESTLPRWISFYWLLRSPFLWWSYFLVGWTLRLHRAAVAARIRPHRIAGAISLGLLAAGAIAVAVAYPSPRTDHQAAWLCSYSLLGLLFALSCAGERMPSWVRFLSDATYGIYLVHLFFVYAAADVFPAPAGHATALSIAVPWAAGLLGSCALVALLRRVLGPRSRSLVGA